MTLSEIQEEAKSLITYDNVSGTLEFAEKLDKSLVDNNIRESNPNAYRELSNIIFQLYVTAIPNLKDESLFNIISFNLIEALSPIWPSERDLATRIESKYSIYPIELIKEMMRKDLLPLLENNNQQIGNMPLRLSQDDPEASPTIANWIEYYNRSVGMNSNHSFSKSKFISGNPIIQTLTSIERESLRKVLSFYDYLQTDNTILYQDLDTDNTILDINNEPVHEEVITPPLPKPIVNPINVATQTPNNTNSEPSQSPTHNGIPQFSPKPVPRMPVPTKSSAPIVLTAKPVPIPKNLVNLRKPE
ncbi:MAG: hypothetical protein ACO3TG_03250 [Minisyncoccia bacterium]